MHASCITGGVVALSCNTIAASGPTAAILPASGSKGANQVFNLNRFYTPAAQVHTKADAEPTDADVKNLFVRWNAALASGDPERVRRVKLHLCFSSTPKAVFVLYTSHVALVHRPGARQCIHCCRCTFAAYLFWC